MKRKSAMRTPVIMQMEASECGAASLSMILEYYRKFIPLERVRIDCGVSRDGSNAKNIVLAAKRYGLTASAYRYEVEDIKNKGKFPCIIHWNFNHFVVLKGFKRDFAYINDPAQGSVRVTMKEFDESFTGICLEFTPSPDFVPEGKKSSVMDFAQKRLKGTGAAIAFVTLTTIIYSIASAINPAFSRAFMDRLLTGENTRWFSPFLALLTAVLAVRIIVGIIKAVYLLKIEGKLAVSANSEYIWHVLRLPMEFFSQRRAGDILERQQTNEQIAATLIETLAPLSLDICMLVLYLVVMMNYSAALTLISVAAVILNAAAGAYIAKKRTNLTRVKMRDEGMLQSTAVSSIEMIDTVKASGSENGIFEKWAGCQSNVNNAEVEFSKIDRGIGVLPELILSVSNIAILVLGVYFTMHGSFTVGMILAFQGFAQSFFAPSESLIGAARKMTEMRADMERVEDVMNYEADVKQSEEIPADADVDKLSGTVELKNVTFGYSKLAPPVLKNVSIKIERGKSIAIVGRSGCGKSTLSKLISGLYKPDEGEILFDGKPIAEINHDIFTSSLAVVDQDIILFEDTISNNIKMWDESIEDFEVILAARDAQIHENIMQRDGGYDCMLTDGGRNFSGGERQRIEIARVLAQDPTIVIMDEATSALDAQTEYDVVRSVKDRGVTCIAVAHRLSTVRDCDEIIVLDKGEIAERGTHEELYKLGGIYKELVSNE